MCNAACDLPIALQFDIDPLAAPAPSVFAVKDADQLTREMAHRNAEVIATQGLHRGLGILMAAIVIPVFKPLGATAKHAQDVTTALVQVLLDDGRRQLGISIPAEWN